MMALTSVANDFAVTTEQSNGASPGPAPVLSLLLLQATIMDIVTITIINFFFIVKTLISRYQQNVVNKDKVAPAFHILTFIGFFEKTTCDIYETG
jgi:hypothetical protein